MEWWPLRNSMASRRQHTRRLLTASTSGHPAGAARWPPVRQRGRLYRRRDRGASVDRPRVPPAGSTVATSPGWPPWAERPGRAPWLASQNFWPGQPLQDRVGLGDQQLRPGRRGTGSGLSTGTARPRATQSALFRLQPPTQHQPPRRWLPRPTTSRATGRPTPVTVTLDASSRLGLAETPHLSAVPYNLRREQCPLCRPSPRRGRPARWRRHVRPRHDG